MGAFFFQRSDFTLQLLFHVLPFDFVCFPFNALLSQIFRFCLGHKSALLALNPFRVNPIQLCLRGAGQLNQLQVVFVHFVFDGIF